MELELRAVNATAAHIDEVGAGVGDPHDSPPEIMLQGCAPGTERVVFRFAPVGGADAHKWAALAAACTQRPAFTLLWGPSGTGESRIRVELGLVEFSVGWNAEGEGGSADVFLSAACCAGAFREAAAVTEAWLAK